MEHGDPSATRMPEVICLVGNLRFAIAGAEKREDGG
jgi:hypothetical protein